MMEANKPGRPEKQSLNLATVKKYIELTRHALGELTDEPLGLEPPLRCGITTVYVFVYASSIYSVL